MNEKRYIQVILPLKLEWEPFYALTDGEDYRKGDRVRVEFAHREYVGVVSGTDVSPAASGVAEDSVKSVIREDSALPPITPEEMAFWRCLADYYLCSVGEVYKAAYPSEKTDKEEVQLRERKRIAARIEKLRTMALKARTDATRERYTDEAARLEAFLQGRLPGKEKVPVNTTPADKLPKAKTVLVESPDPDKRTEFYLELAINTVNSGKSVLYLVPEIALSRQLEQKVASVFPGVLVYNSAKSYVGRRAVASALREGGARLVLGTRSALFLPFSNLGLVIVDEEHDQSYKQDSPAPRYNARESAIMLAGIHGANVVLGSATPSFESLYNADKGIFVKTVLKDSFKKSPASVELVDTSAETRKNGMSGSFSLQLLGKMKAALEKGEKVLLVCRSKASVPEYIREIEAIFPGSVGITATTPSGARTTKGSFSVIAVIQADSLLSREDFRSDERALQLLGQLRGRTGTGTLVIQTREPAHPVFKSLRDGVRDDALLKERLSFGYPPYTRLVDVIVRDSNAKRLAFLSRALTEKLEASIPGRVRFEGGDGTARIRITLPRDKQLKASKALVKECVERFEKEKKYSGHISLDVDPA